MTFAQKSINIYRILIIITTTMVTKDLIVYHYKMLMIPFIAHAITSENQCWAQTKAHKMFLLIYNDQCFAL